MFEILLKGGLWTVRLCMHVSMNLQKHAPKRGWLGIDWRSPTEMAFGICRLQRSRDF